MSFGTRGAITIIGWAIDESAQREAGGVLIAVDDEHTLTVKYGMDRPDVARAFGNNRCRFAGFVASLDASSMKIGHHKLKINVLTADRSGYYESDQKIDIQIR